MTRDQARESARDILEIIPLVMRTVAAELRSAGEMPAPAHFGLLSILIARPRSLTELAALQGVSLPTMSNSISAMVERGWLRRTTPAAPSVAPGSKNVVARLFGVLFTPRSTYADIAAHPRWLAAMLIIVVVIAGSTFAFLSTEVGTNAMLDQNMRMMESFGVKMSD